MAIAFYLILTIASDDLIALMLVRGTLSVAIVHLLWPSVAPRPSFGPPCGVALRSPRSPWCCCAAVISNSYGGSESASDTNYDTSYYHHPGVAITASSGDNGYGVEYPAASQYVTAVGGTTLAHASNTRGWNETVWSGAGSGCSTYDPKPSWQTDTASCSTRTVADVAAVADPNTVVAVYDSYSSSGWLVFGGTSVASPVIGSVYALAGNAKTVAYGSFPYSNPGSLFDVTSGSNGACNGSYLCTGATSYDGPTGLGTPNGTTAF